MMNDKISINMLSVSMQWLLMAFGSGQLFGKPNIMCLIMKRITSYVYIYRH